MRRPSIRSPWALPVFASAVTLGMVLVLVLDPFYGPAAEAALAPQQGGADYSQTFAANGHDDSVFRRDNYSVTQLGPSGANAPAAGVPDPGTAKAIALVLLQRSGLGSSEYDCLVALWERESHWNVYASNGSSGAYGIPQALPGNKMASAGPNWQSNPRTQILWGLSYIKARYKTPCGAWAHSQSSGWY